MPPPLKHGVPLAPRPLGQTGLFTSPVIWQVESKPDSGVLNELSARGLDAFFWPSDCEAPLGQFELSRSATPDHARTWLGVGADDLMPRDMPRVRKRLAEAARCDVIVLEDADISDLKGGRAFQRLLELRHEGAVAAIAIQAGDLNTARWVLENTAAQVLVLPFGLGDLTAAYTLLPDAQQLGFAVVAQAPAETVWTPALPYDVSTDLAYRVSTPGVCASLAPMPANIDDVKLAVHGLAAPMSESSHQAWWAEFSERIPAPTARKGRTSADPEG